MLDINEEEEEEENEEEQDVEDDFFDLDRVNESEATELFASENTICEVEEELFTESFTLKGSSYHEHFQNALKSCKQKIINKESVPVKLSFEPVNKRDENAILWTLF